MDNIPDMDKIFSEYDVIVKSHDIKKCNMYECFQNSVDVNYTLDIIKEKFPDYYNISLKEAKERYFFNRNIFIMKSEDFIEYGKFCFGVLREFDRRHNLELSKRLSDQKSDEVNKDKTKMKKYSRRFNGYILEYLSQFFYMTKFKKMFEININDFKKNPNILITNNPSLNLYYNDDNDPNWEYQLNYTHNNTNINENQKIYTKLKYYRFIIFLLIIVIIICIVIFILFIMKRKTIDKNDTFRNIGNNSIEDRINTKISKIDEDQELKTASSNIKEENNIKK